MIGSSINQGRQNYKINFQAIEALVEKANDQKRSTLFTADDPASVYAGTIRLMRENLDQQIFV